MKKINKLDDLKDFPGELMEIYTRAERLGIDEEIIDAKFIQYSNFWRRQLNPEICKRFRYEATFNSLHRYMNRYLKRKPR